MEKIKPEMIGSAEVSAGISWDDIKNFINGFVAVMSLILNKYLEYSGLSCKAMNMLVILLLADTFTGWIKSLVLKIYSRKLFYFGILKKLVLLVIPLVLRALAEFSKVEGVMLFNTYCILIAVHEAESFFGNIYTIRTGKQLPEKDILSIAARYIYNFLDNLLEKTFSILKGKKDEDSQ